MLPALLIVLIVIFVVVPLVGMALWAIASTVAIGLLIGALGRLIVPGSQPIGCLSTAVAGLAGSLVGSIIGHVVHAGSFGVVLLEVAVAAVLVAVMARFRPRLRPF